MLAGTLETKGMDSIENVVSSFYKPGAYSGLKNVDVTWA